MSGKRQLRNPRVKHRLKYKKALLKRKSQVNLPCWPKKYLAYQLRIIVCVCYFQSLPVAREMSKYAGEVTGIKALLSRSTVIAS